MKQLFYRDETGREIPFTVDSVQVPERGFLLVKVGDPVTSWLPSQDDIDALATMFKEMGLHNHLIYHYGVEAVPIAIPPDDQRLLLIVKVGDPVTSWVPEKEERDTLETEIRALLQKYPNVDVKVTHYAVDVYPQVSK